MLPSTTFAALELRPPAPGEDRPTRPHRTRRARHSRSLASQTSPRAMNTATIAGAASTLMFAGSTLPMVVRAVRTRDLSSYSRSHLFMTNAGNAVHTVYIASLPPGPVWLLHCMYSGVAVFMLAAHRRWARPPCPENRVRLRDGRSRLVREVPIRLERELDQTGGHRELGGFPLEVVLGHPARLAGHTRYIEASTPACDRIKGFA